jgi:hypothetical protein
MTVVWDSERYEGGDLLVLLALADWASDQGRCFPSIPSIAKKARLSERQVYNVLRKMRADGVITSEPGGGRGNPTVYVINTAMVAGFRKTETLQPVASKPCNLVHINPEICDKPLEPLKGRTVKEPSRNHHQTAVRAATQSVCLAGTFVGRDIEQIISEAISKAIEHPDCELSAGQIAEAMARRWGEYQDALHLGLLRYQYGPEKFFSGGHWRKDAAWPFDQQQLRLHREAMVGVSR